MAASRPAHDGPAVSGVDLVAPGVRDRGRGGPERQGGAGARRPPRPKPPEGLRSPSGTGRRCHRDPCRTPSTERREWPSVAPTAGTVLATLKKVDATAQTDRCNGTDPI